MEEIKKENCLLLKRIEESEAESRTSKALLGLAEGRVKEMEAALQRLGNVWWILVGEYLLD